MAAWGATDWTHSAFTVSSEKLDVTPSKEDVRSVLKLISGIDRIEDAPPNSCSGKCAYYTKVFFGRTPWVTAFCFIVHTVTFSLTATGNMDLTDKLNKHDFKSESVLSIAVLVYSVIVNFFVYVFCLSGSRFCLAKRFSKWGSGCICKLYILKMWEGLLFCLTAVSLLLVGLDGFGLIANSVSLASMKVVCDLNSGNDIPGYIELADDDDILTAFLKVSTVESNQVNTFCADMNDIRSTLSKFWYANFFAIVAQVMLTISAYRNFLITSAVYESSCHGSDVDAEMERKKKERERAKELKKQQKEARKTSKKNLEEELTLNNSAKGSLTKTNDGNSYKSSRNGASAYASSANTPSAYGVSSPATDSAYGVSPESNRYDATPVENEPVHVSFELDTGKSADEGGAFDGGEWWKDSGV